MRETGPIRLAIIGMGGFAGRHQAAVQELEQSGEARLVCTCDPAVDSFAQQMRDWEFEKRGVEVFTNYIEMLESCRARLDMVVIPTPIHLHAPMHSKCVELGLPVYLEKPPTLDPEELEAMIALDLRQEKQTSIPFHFIVEQPRQELKERLLKGDFGRLQRVTLFGVAPRATSYFTRSNWAGKLMMGAHLVLDSCMGNAMAHQVHNLLYWAGTEGVFSWAEPEQVEAELYRAHDIQGTDTVFVRARLNGGVEARIFLTHANAGKGGWEERVECERANLLFRSGETNTIEWRDGRVERIEPDPRNLLQEHHRWFYSYLRGERERPLTTLSDSRPFVHLNNLAYLSASCIRSVNTDHLERTSAQPAAGDFLSIQNIAPIGRRFIQDAVFPSDQNLPWASGGRRTAVSTDLPRLRSEIERLLARK